MQAWFCQKMASPAMNLGCVQAFSERRLLMKMQWKCWVHCQWIALWAFWPTSRRQGDQVFLRPQFGNRFGLKVSYRVSAFVCRSPEKIDTKGRTNLVQILPLSTSMTDWPQEKANAGGIWNPNSYVATWLSPENPWNVARTATQTGKRKKTLAPIAANKIK